MGRSPQCSTDGLSKGAWTPAEDKILRAHVKVHGEGKWSTLAKRTGLKRCGKSCRLRWRNYLRPDIKRGNISYDEEELIIRLHKLLGNRWSLIAGRLPGRTDNEIKNYWNTNLSKKPKDFYLSHQLEPKVVPRAITEDNYHQGPMNMSTTTKRSSSENNIFVETARQLDNNNQSNTYVQTGPSHLSKSKNIDQHLSFSKGYQISNSGDFMDLNVEEICKFLDNDMDDKKGNLSGGGEGDGGGDLLFFDKLVDMGSSDLLSLASSFLESAEEWPEDDLNISMSALPKHC